MSHVCMVTTHPFWREPLGCGTLLRSRYELLQTIATQVSVLFITHTDQRCPLPGGTLRMPAGGVQASHIEAIQGFMKSRQVTLAYFSYDQFSGLAGLLPCETAVEIHDVMYLRQQQFVAHGYAFPASVDQRQELQSLSGYDHVFSINPNEVTYLRSHGLKSATYLPPNLPFRRIDNTSDARRFGLIASQAVPNRDGFERIKPWLSNAGPLVLAGPLAASELAALPGHPDLTNLGVLDSPDAFYQAVDVALSPVRFGAGLKIKVLEALSHGKPLLATGHSIDGFPEGVKTVVRVEDELDAWSDSHLQEARAIDSELVEEWYRDSFDPAQTRQVLQACL